MLSDLYLTSYSNDSGCNGYVGAGPLGKRSIQSALTFCITWVQEEHIFLLDTNTILRSVLKGNNKRGHVVISCGCSWISRFTLVQSVSWYFKLDLSVSWCFPLVHFVPECLTVSCTSLYGTFIIWLFPDSISIYVFIGTTAWWHFIIGSICFWLFLGSVFSCHTTVYKRRQQSQLDQELTVSKGQMKP